jgi:hypothetical protein
MHERRDRVAETEQMPEQVDTVEQLLVGQTIIARYEVADA